MLLYASIAGLISLLPAGVGIVVSILIVAFVIFTIINIILSVIWIIDQLKGLFHLL